MTISFARLLLLIGVPWLLGAGLLRAIGVQPREDRVAWIGHAWFAGALALAVLLHAWLLAGLRLEAGAISACALFAAGALAFVGTRRREVAAAVVAPFERRRGRWWLWLALAVVCLVTLDRIVHANQLAVVLGDEAEIFARKAKSLYLSGGFNERLRELSSRVGGHSDYPMLDSMLQLWTFVVADAIVHVDNRLPLQAGVLAAACVLAAGLRRRLAPLPAILLLLIWVAARDTEDMTRKAAADGLVAFAFLATIDSWLRFAETGSAGWWRLAMVEAGATAWAKNEGRLLLVALLAGILVAIARDAELRRRVRALGRGIAWPLAPLALILVHDLVNRHLGWRNDLTSPIDAPPVWSAISSRLTLEPIGMLLRYFGRILVVDRSPLAPRFVALEGVLVAGFLGFALLAPSGARAGGRIAVKLAVLVALIGYACVYLGTPMNLHWHLETSADRVLSQLVPASALGLGAWWGASKSARAGAA